MDYNKYEPEPERNKHPAVWQEVLQSLRQRPDVPSTLLRDMQQRDDFGRQKYGTPLQPFNGRNPIIDAYQEALDLVVYTKQAVIEATKNSRHPLSLRGPKLVLIHLAAIQCAINLRRVLDEGGGNASTVS